MPKVFVAPSFGQNLSYTLGGLLDTLREDRGSARANRLLQYEEERRKLQQEQGEASGEANQLRLKMQELLANPPQQSGVPNPPALQGLGLPAPGQAQSPFSPSGLEPSTAALLDEMRQVLPRMDPKEAQLLLDDYQIYAKQKQEAANAKQFLGDVQRKLAMPDSPYLYPNETEIRDDVRSVILAGSQAVSRGDIRTDQFAEREAEILADIREERDKLGMMEAAVTAYPEVPGVPATRSAIDQLKADGDVPGFLRRRRSIEDQMMRLRPGDDNPTQLALASGVAQGADVNRQSAAAAALAAGLGLGVGGNAPGPAPSGTMGGPAATSAETVTPWSDLEPERADDLKGQLASLVEKNDWAGIESLLDSSRVGDPPDDVIAELSQKSRSRIEREIQEARARQKELRRELKEAVDKMPAEPEKATRRAITKGGMRGGPESTGASLDSSRKMTRPVQIRREIAKIEQELQALRGKLRELDAAAGS